MNLPEALRWLSANPVRKGEHPISAARSDRMNAIQDAIMALARGENIGRGHGIRRRVTQGSFTLSADIARGGRGGGPTDTPFLVYQAADNSEPPYPVLKLIPGKIAGVVPKIGLAPLDQAPLPVTPQPWLYTPGQKFEIYLQCVIDLTDPLIAYRSHIKEVFVKMSTETDVIADAATLAPAGIRDGSLVWTGASQAEIDAKNKGRFYINVATVFGATVEGNIVVNGIVQWLFNSYRTFALTDDEAIALA